MACLRLVKVGQERVETTIDFGAEYMKQDLNMGLTSVAGVCDPAMTESVRFRYRRGAFTAIELLIVVVIIAIAAMVAIPLSGSASGTQLRAAANIVASDLEYAKSMAISRGQNYSVDFDAGAESYRILDQGGNVIGHPVKKGFDYVVSFGGSSRLGKVGIVSSDFDSTDVVNFDYLGSPYNGSGNPLNSGIITLQAGTATLTVSVEAVTGFISVQ
jgi:prepilin-type N-terminal cleavage/methylation domain-containing protein